ncbi:MAG: hypothetical protein A2731_03655 [Candidatus Buchananbacteria bacterium RIFCSPHIGHO2_01_FULL_39_8]|uniref:Calcineurin-like phosphoesterase domain-containing protein n=1 Tax=Candidatus Buchananbacteria bacterium RIFCSPHIGHO2_01_FULL_39_8 TaxID=1797533 RepID=A0A1G1Y259_9BACT|nr:MAG: hypothetical protein A2731_03655 [Candidatus Buchananbacteria bacterium RIFCSPHIGHO2_01_FULL_39_8]
MNRIRVHTIALSDTHFGLLSGDRIRELIQILRAEFEFRQLLLVGDIVDSLPLLAKELEFFSFLSELSESGVKVVWIKGNHDIDFRKETTGAAAFYRIPFCREYTWTFGGRNYLAIHGHQFDTWVTKNGGWRNKVISRFIWILQQIDRRQRLYGLLKCNPHIQRIWKRNIEKVANAAFRYVKKYKKKIGGLRRKKKFKIHVILCGHTHHVEEITRNGVTYVNAGSCGEGSLTFVTVDLNGGIQIHHRK